MENALTKVKVNHWCKALNKFVLYYTVTGSIYFYSRLLCVHVLAGSKVGFYATVVVKLYNTTIL